MEGRPSVVLHSISTRANRAPPVYSVSSPAIGSVIISTCPEALIDAMRRRKAESKFAALCLKIAKYRSTTEQIFVTGPENLQHGRHGGAKICTGTVTHRNFLRALRARHVYTLSSQAPSPAPTHHSKPHRPPLAAPCAAVSCPTPTRLLVPRGGETLTAVTAARASTLLRSATSRMTSMITVGWSRTGERDCAGRSGAFVRSVGGLGPAACAPSGRNFRALRAHAKILRFASRGGENLPGVRHGWGAKICSVVDL